MRPGTVSGGGSGGGYSMGPGDKIWNGSMSFNRPEGDTAVTETHRFHHGHELTITERLRMGEDGRTLIYTHEITGPGGKQERREIVFDIG